VATYFLLFPFYFSLNSIKLSAFLAWLSLTGGDTGFLLFVICFLLYFSILPTFGVSFQQDFSASQFGGFVSRGRGFCHSFDFIPPTKTFKGRQDRYALRDDGG
jgi:hypothetical protein